jgi:hypothetical protein
MTKQKVAKRRKRREKKKKKKRRKKGATLPSAGARSKVREGAVCSGYDADTISRGNN